MLSPFPIIVLASQLITVATKNIPVFDVPRSCRAEGSTVESVERCTRDERKARNQIQTEWSRFGPAAQSSCTRETAIDGTASYVELLTCLEMAKDANAHTSVPGKPRISGKNQIDDTVEHHPLPFPG
jgi:hypothetical protein